MRLDDRDVQIMRQSFTSLFGPDDHLWLFGSRVNDAKKGGDIDLYIQTHLPAEDAYRKRQDFVIDLWDKIGEQKIDVVIHLIDTDFHLPIYDVAQQEGVLLV
jgi:hypothetical protein